MKTFDDASVQFSEALAINIGGFSELLMALMEMFNSCKGTNDISGATKGEQVTQFIRKKPRLTKGAMRRELREAGVNRQDRREKSERLYEKLLATPTEEITAVFADANSR